MTPGVDSILALDLATRTGWAFRDVDGSICFGSERFEGADRFYRAYNVIGCWLDELEPSLVAVEGWGGIKGDAIPILWGLLGVARAACERRIIAIDEYATDAWKHWLGKGGMTKPEYIQAVRALGHDVANEDEAAAVGILLAAVKRHLT